MSDGSKIEWTDATWQPITGCSIVSPGCANCYAMKLAGTRLKHHPSRAGLTVDSKAGPVWNGEVRFNAQWLTQPLAWKKPRRIFVCAHGDLFHESVPDAWIDQVFAVMALAPQHTFQVLTKRGARMRAYIERKIANAPEWIELPALSGKVLLPYEGGIPKNVWLGVSCERQQEADERVIDLLRTPAAVRFVSAEPLIGPIDFRDLRFMDEDAEIKLDALNAEAWVLNSDSAAAYTNEADGNTRLDWIIAGGESGDRAMHPAWARQIRDDCAATGIAFFFKQWGDWAPSTPEQAVGNPRAGWTPARAHPRVPKANELYPDAGAAFMERVGKARAGRMLDGTLHNAMPQDVDGRVKPGHDGERGEART